MTTNEMRDALDEIGFGQRDFAVLVDKDERLIRRMMNGTEPIMAEIAALLRMIIHVRRWRYSGRIKRPAEKE